MQQPEGMKKSMTGWAWGFIAVTLIQAAIVLAIEGYIFSLFESALLPGTTNSPYSRTIPTYLALYIFGFLYENWLAWDALTNMNTIQVIGLCIYNLGLMVYSSLQRDQMHDSISALMAIHQLEPTEDILHQVSPLLIVVPSMLAAGTVILCLLSWKLYDEFAWTIYKHITADLRMKRRYLNYQVYLALLKFDFFFFLGFTVQFCVIVIDHQSLEFALTVAVIPLTIIVLIVAHYVVKKENTPGMVVVIVSYRFLISYLTESFH
jgi:hypothetical protein